MAGKPKQLPLAKQATLRGINVLCHCERSVAIFLFRLLCRFTPRNDDIYMIKNIKRDHQKGSTLVEVLLGLAIATIALSGVTVVAISSLSNAQQGRNQIQATKYSQEGIEIVRRIRNSDYAAFANYNGTYCLGTNQTTLGVAATCTTPNVGQFIRSVQIEQNAGCGASLARATVRVAWTDAKCSAGVYCHSSQLQSCFSTVNPVQGP